MLAGHACLLLLLRRRSAVARQAAHLFAVLAAALGIKFDAYAITFMSAIYKGLVITVQVGMIERGGAGGGRSTGIDCMLC